MKKALSLVVALMMLMSLCITPVMAAEPQGSESNPYYVANPMTAPSVITIPANSTVYYQYMTAVFGGWEVGGYGLSAIIVDGVVYDTPDMWGEIYAPLNFTFVSPGIVGYVNSTDEDVEVMISHNEPVGTANNPDELVAGENVFTIPANVFPYIANFVPTADGEYTFACEQTEDVVITIDADGNFDDGIYETLDGTITLELESYVAVQVAISPMGMTPNVTITVTAPEAGTEGNPHWLSADTMDTGYILPGAGSVYFDVDGSLAGNTLLIESKMGNDLMVELDGVSYVAETGVLYLPLETSEWVMSLVISQDQEMENVLYFSVDYAEGSYENPLDIALGDNAISIPEGVDGYYYAYTVEKDGLLIVTPAAVDGISYLAMANEDYSSYAYLQEGASYMQMPVTAGEVILLECYPAMDEEFVVPLGLETTLNLALKDLVVYSDFESGDVDGWSTSSSLSVDDMDYISGWYSGKFEVTADWGNIYRNIKLEPNTNYVVSFKAKAALEKVLWIKFNNNWAYDVAQGDVNLTTEWADYEVTLNSGELGDAVLLLQYAGYGADGQIIWLDDFIITKAEESGEEPPVENDNLVVNGDFETGNAKGWEIWQSTEISADAAHNGSYGAHLMGNGGWGGLLNQTFTVVPGEMYKLSFWLNVNQNGVNVQVRDGSGSSIEGAGGWFDANNIDKLVEWTFTATDSSVLINFCGAGNGIAEDVYVDDFTVVKVAPPTVEGGIVNGDFETGDLTGWINLWDSCTVEFVEGYESNNAASIVAGNWSQVRQDGIAVEPNTDYVLTAWVKNNTNFGLIVKTGDDSDDIASLLIGDATEWQKIELPFNSGDQTEICVLLIGWEGGGSAIVDSVSLAVNDNPVSEEGIVNGDFETGDATGWETWQGTVISGDAAHGGSYGAHLIGDGSWGGLLNQTFTVTPGQQYKLSFWVQVNAVGVNVQVTDGSGAALEGAGGYLDASNQDCLVEWIFTATDDSVKINFCGSGTGVAEDIYVDDFALVKTEGGDPSVDPEGIVNGDFETGNADGWETWQGTVISGDAAHGGSYGVHLIGNGGWGGLLNQTFTVTPGQLYKLSFWVQVNAVGVNVQVTDGSGAALEGAGGYLDASNQDCLVEWTFTATDDSVKINFCGSGTGTAEDVYVDDFALVKTEGGDPSVDPEGIVNGDFETGDLTGWVNLWGSCEVGFVEGFESDVAISIVAGNWSQVRQDGIAVEPNTDYVLTAWVKNNTNFGLIVKKGDDSGDITSLLVDDGSEWKQVELKFNSGDQTEICVLLIGWEGGGSAVIDNVVLAKDEGDDPIVPDYMPGDINSDGRINNKDLGILKQHLGDWEDLEMNLNACDVNGDGRINNKDLGILQQFLNDWDVELKYGAIVE